MSEPHQAVQQMIMEACRLDNATAQYANTMASLLVGKLRHADLHTLAALKKELANYNIHTGRWKT